MNPVRFGGRTKPPHRHRWMLTDVGNVCRDCGREQDAVATRRGRNNRKRGGRAELDIARTYGGEKVGPLGLPEDIRGTNWSTQVKVSQRPPPVMWVRELAKLEGGQRTPRLILRFTKAGVGHQDYVVVRGEDWLAWFGKDE